MFLRHVPAKYRNEAPVVVTDDRDVDVSIRARKEWARLYQQNRPAKV
jgi:hypothetical protein